MAPRKDNIFNASCGEGLRSKQRRNERSELAVRAPAGQRTERSVVSNFYEKIRAKDKVQYHNPSYNEIQITVPFRMLVIGKSGTMKTNSILDLMQKMNGTFERIIIMCRNKDEDLYRYLDNLNIGIEFIEVQKSEDIPDLDSFDLPTKTKLKNSGTGFGQYLCIFDDLVIMRDQKIIEEYFIRSRKIANGISLCYIAQSYFKINQIIRQQANYILLKQLSSTRDLSRILAEFSLPVNYEELKKLHQIATKKKEDFLLIDLENENDRMKVRHNYSPF